MPQGQETAYQRNLSGAAIKNKCTDVDYDHCSFDIHSNRIPDAKEDAGAEAHYTISRP